MPDGYAYTASKDHWTSAHLEWLRKLNPEGLYEEILQEYLPTYQTLTERLERLNRRIEELAKDDAYEASVRKLCCFLGVKARTTLAAIVEAGDFKCFSSAEQFASYIGLVSSEDSGSGDQNPLGITKAGNRHVRMLLVEAAQSFSRGKIGSNLPP